MAARLRLVCCENFKPEISAAVAAEAWTDVEVAAYPAQCGRPPLKTDALRAQLSDGCSHIIAVGRACLAHVKLQPEDDRTIRVLSLRECFHLVAGATLISELLDEGSYLITPAWLQDWRESLKTLGFKEAQAAEFFQEFATKLVLLDTGVFDDLPDKLLELSGTLGLPATRIAVGLDHTRAFLGRIVAEWRLDQANHNARRKEEHLNSTVADHVAAMQFLQEIAILETEEDVIAAIELMFRSLFAPEQFFFLPTAAAGAWATGPVPADVLRQAQGLTGAWAWTPSKDGFLLRIGDGTGPLGIIVLDHLTFPVYAERYLNLALSVTGVCALAIRNARNFQDRLRKTEQLSAEIDERRRIEEQLREREGALSIGQVITKTGSWFFDFLDDRLIWPQETYQLFGVSVNVPISMDAFMSCVHEADRTRVAESWSNALAGTNYDLEHRIVVGNTIRWVREAALIDRDETGRPLRAVGVVQDITERKEMERKLVQAQKMEAVGQLTGGIAHDFNNILSIILGNLELLQSSTLDDRNQKRIGNALRATHRGAELTHRLLAFSRRQALDPKAVDVNELLTSMTEMLVRTLGETIEILGVPDPTLWPAMVDPSQLENAVLNLALNARDAMPEGGRLTLEAKNIFLNEEFAESRDEVIPGNYVCLSISDTGHGMPPDVLNRVFEPFFTTKGVGKGSGLGLSMVYGFVKQSKGHVSIYSEEGQGTTVKLYLPTAGRPASHQEPSNAQRPVAPLANKRILVVEDEPDVRETAVSILSGHGYLIVEASTGADALRKLREEGPFDLLFTDVVLPGGMNGAQLAKEAVRHQNTLKVLYTTGYSENAVVHHGRLDENVVLITKPYRLTDLVEHVQRLLLEEP